MRYRLIRHSDAPTPTATLALIGLVVGGAVGFLLGELYAREGTRRLRSGFEQLRRRFRQPPSPGTLTDELHQRLTATLGQESEALELVAVGRDAVELHGWVASRAARTRACRAARAALAPEIRLIERLLVWGEDDLPLADAPRPEEA